MSGERELCRFSFVKSSGHLNHYRIAHKNNNVRFIFEKVKYNSGTLLLFVSLVFANRSHSNATSAPSCRVHYGLTVKKNR
jgi:hypothetical protein